MSDGPQTFEVGSDLLIAARDHPEVIAHLHVIAERIKREAEALAEVEGVDVTITTEEFKRPTGRTVVNVIADNADQEFGTRKTKRRRLLGRAAERGK